ASPLVQCRQDVVGGYRHQADIDPRRTQVAEQLQPVEIVGRAADRDRQRGRIAPGILRHLAEGWQVFLGIPARSVRIPAVAVADRAPRRPRKGAAENDWRMPLLHLLRPSAYRPEIDK